MKIKQQISITTIATRTATQWQKQTKDFANNRRKIGRAQQFALELLDYMDDHQIKQKDLGILMNVSPQQITKILSGKANLTFETIDKIEAALKVEISTPTIQSSYKEKQMLSSPMQFAERQILRIVPNTIVEEDKKTAKIIKMTPLLSTTILSMNEYSQLLRKI